MKLVEGSHLEIGNMKLTYVSDTAADYVMDTKAAKSREELLNVIGQYQPFAFDALIQASLIEDWKEYVAAVATMKRKNADEKKLHVAVEKYGAIAMPKQLLLVSMAAARFGAPFGCAAIRLAECGRLTEVDGCAVVNLGKMQ